MSRARRRAGGAGAPRATRRAPPPPAPLAAAGPRPEARIGAGEWAFVSLWTLALLLVIAAPYWHGYWTAGPGWRFSGFVGAYHNDYSGYLAWMRQARDGHLLFKDYY